MKNSIKDLQINLAKDLVSFEKKTNLTKQQLKLIENVYQKIYLKLQKLDRRD